MPTRKALPYLLLVALVALMPSLGHAAEFTEVADAFDKKNPFDFRLEISWRYTMESAVVARERGTPLRFEHKPEFNLSHDLQELVFSPSIGIFRDLELRAWIPVVLSQTIGGQVSDPSKNPSLLTDKIINRQTFRSSHGPGLGDMTVGLNWGVTNDYRDFHLATWVIGFRWTIPSPSLWDPRDHNKETSGAGTGKGAHRLTWSFRLSRRQLIFDPYVGMHYTLAIVPEQTKRDLSLKPQDPRVVERALKPGHQAGLTLGSEFVPWENRAKSQKLSIDVRFWARAIFQGRDYSLLTDELAEFEPEKRASAITDLEEHFVFGVMGAVHFRVAKYGYFRAQLSYAYTTPFYVTNAKAGVDEDGNGVVDPGTNEVYPYHYRKLDGVGRRIRLQDNYALTMLFSAGLTL